MNAGEIMKETIYHTFGIDVRQFMPYGSYQSFQTAKALFIIVPVSHLREEELTELYHISQYLLNDGDPYVAVFELTNEEKPTFTHGKELYALLKAKTAGYKPLISARTRAGGLSCQGKRVSL